MENRGTVQSAVIGRYQHDEVSCWECYRLEMVLERAEEMDKIAAALARLAQHQSEVWGVRS